jgi:hypothetical protein
MSPSIAAPKPPLTWRWLFSGVIRVVGAIPGEALPY